MLLLRAATFFLALRVAALGPAPSAMPLRVCAPSLGDASLSAASLSADSSSATPPPIFSLPLALPLDGRPPDAAGFLIPPLALSDTLAASPPPCEPLVPALPPLGVPALAIALAARTASLRSASLRAFSAAIWNLRLRILRRDTLALHTTGPPVHWQHLLQRGQSSGSVLRPQAA